MSLRDLRDEEHLDAIHDLNASGGYTALGVQIFGGAFSIGMEQAGLTTIGHLEHSAAPLGVNPSRQRWPVHVGDEHEWARVARSLVDHPPRVVYANTPCVAYAGTGNHDGTMGDAMCYLRWFIHRVAFEIRPEIWAWELVPGIWGKDKAWLESIAFKASMMGYRSTVFLTTSAVHGGHQHRKRFHFIASKYELDIEGVYDREPETRRGWRPLSDVLLDLDGHRINAVGVTPAMVQPELGILPNDSEIYKGAFRSLFPYVPPGSHVRDLPDSIMEEHYRPRGTQWKPGMGLPGFGHTRARMDRVSPNVMGGHTIIHPEQDRYLTPRECASIQGFPIDYEFTDSSVAYAEIGKGLCTQNARFVGAIIKDALDRERPVKLNGPTKNIDCVDWRNGVGGAKVGVDPLVMSADDQRSWWRYRHGTEPPDGFGTKRS